MNGRHKIVDDFKCRILLSWCSRNTSPYLYSCEGDRVADAIFVVISYKKHTLGFYVCKRTISLERKVNHQREILTVFAG